MGVVRRVVSVGVSNNHSGCVRHDVVRSCLDVVFDGRVGRKKMDGVHGTAVFSMETTLCHDVIQKSKKQSSP
jgi:hypothetical protein